VGVTKDLQGQWAIVTGGARGIGAGIVQALAAAGAGVTIFDLVWNERTDDFVRQLQQSGCAIETMTVDVSDSAQVNAAVQQVATRHPVIDIVVNNAGICPFEDLEHVTDEIWYRTINVNLSGMFFVVRAMVPVFRRQNHGAVVNISTVSTHIGTPHQVHYIASKGGVDGLTRALAVALAPYQVRVNAVAPGGVQTEINANVEEQRAAWLRSGVPMPSAHWMPIARSGEPAEIAAAVKFLVSNEARYITGAIVPVDGGALIV
jgi:NAD(P)-dependent dehydrogenase (short-subunit alcohol dehydrogenase family)